MKEASGELNMTLITIVAIAAIAGLFALLWPTAKNMIPNKLKMELLDTLIFLLVQEEQVRLVLPKYLPKRLIASMAKMAILVISVRYANQLLLALMWISWRLMLLVIIELMR